jgi:hypothetical protein
MLTEHKQSHVYSLQDVFHPESTLIATAVSEGIDVDDSDAVDNWGVVWAEAMLIPPVVYVSTSASSISTMNDTINETRTNHGGSQNEPSQFYDTDGTQSQEGSPETHPLQGAIFSTTTSAIPTNQQSQENAFHGYNNASSTENVSDYLSMPNFIYLDVIFGFPLTLAAGISTFSLELTGSIVYFMAVGFWYAASLLPLSSTGPLLWIFYFIFLLLSGIFMMLDALFLILSVCLTELFAIVGGGLTFLTGGVKSAISWHQYIRRLCHLYRWAWRNSQSTLTPNRSFPLIPLNKARSNIIPGDEDIEISQVNFHERGSLQIYEHDADELWTMTNSFVTTSTQACSESVISASSNEPGS